ncbi:MAG: transcriptional repressor [Planctomycetes bacterium]|nr:transcriptional repressor [Planctomycetota bacterium]
MKRKTIQRAAIERVFQEGGQPLGVEEILSRGRANVHSLNLVTVYRNLKLLVESGWLKSFHHASFGTLYERAAKGHHHHFHCQECKRVYEIPGCSLRRESGLPEGFVVEDHEIFLFGKCPACAV